MKKFGSLRYIILGMLISGVMFGTGAYAATIIISADKVGYTDNSSLGATNVQAAIDGTCTKFNTQLTNLKGNIVDTMWPVGSIYTSETDSTATAVQNRFKAFGKDTTWVAYGAGKVLVGSGTGTDSNGKTQAFSVANNNKNLGEYTHKLTVSEMPSHTHSSNYFLIYTSNSYAALETAVANGVPDRAGWVSGNNVLNSTGGSGAHNNIQPYTTVYMYKRTK